MSTRTTAVNVFRAIVRHRAHRRLPATAVERGLHTLHVERLLAGKPQRGSVFAGLKFEQWMRSKLSAHVARPTADRSRGKLIARADGSRLDHLSLFNRCANNTARSLAP